MATYFPPKTATAYIMYVGLESVATAGTFQSSATLAAGDFKVSIDGGSLNNLTTLPTVAPGSSKMVKISLSGAEMTGDNITIVCSDAAGSEWKDLIINLQTVARQIDDLSYPATTGRSTAVNASGQVGVDWANVGAPSTTVSLSGTTVATVTTTTTATNLTNAPTSGDFTATMKTSITTAVPTAATIATAVWATLASAATTVNSLGKLIVDNLDAVVSAVKAKTDLIPASPASTTNITGGTITTVTNLTNAPTSGDLTATMKTSVTTAATAATPIVASVTGAVGSVTGNVVGSIGSLATQAKADVNAEADTALADAGVTTTVTGRIDAAITSRMATFVYTAPTTPPTVAQIDTQLSGTHGSGGWATATGFATPSDVMTAQAAVTAAITALNNLSDVQVVNAIKAYEVETGHSFDTVQKRLYAIVRNRSVANDPTNPTRIDYYAPDNTTIRVTHTLTDTERTVA